MIRALFDTNIILDIALQRENFFEDSSQLFLKIDDGVLEGFVTATTLTDIYYISAKVKGKKEAMAFLKNLIGVVDFIGVDRQTIFNAINANFSDFEDAIQSCSAELNEITHIITRNKKHFKNQV